MLEACHAYVVGKDEEHDRSLVEMTTLLGFTSVARLMYKGRPRIDTRNESLSFFLVHNRLDEEIMRSVIATVRHSEQDAIRFAPLIVLLDDGPFELVLRYVRMGFDDIIALPERRELVVSRLEGQLGQEITYFRTPNYLGPDRRRMELPGEPQDERRTGSLSRTRYTILRSPDRGVRLVRKEVIGAAPAPLGAPPRPTGPLATEPAAHAERSH